MSRSTLVYKRLLLAVTMLIASLLLLAPIHAQEAKVKAPKDFPDGAGKEYVQQICMQCHQPEFLLQQHRTAADWKTTVARMSRKGAGGPPEAYDTVAAYMAKFFPEIVGDAVTINMNTATADEIAARIGLTKEEAAALVDYRMKNGNFRYWGDMLIIYGVDGKKLAAAKDRMVF